VTDQETKDQVAAGLFTGFMALALGGAGVLIAAFAVAVERWWNGRGDPAAPAHHAGEHARLDHRAWLAMDRERQRRWREARRRWWDSGADPATRPAQPGGWQRFRDWWHRRWAQTALAADRFLEGWRAGWAAAQQARRDGGSFTDIAGARPAPTDQTPASTEPGQPDPAPSSQPTAEPDEPTPSDQPAASSTPDQQAPTQPPQEQEEEEPMTQSTAAPAAAPQGETHQDLTALDLAAIQIELGRANEQVDQLAQTKANLEALVTRCSERVASKGGTTATAQALEAAQQAIAQLNQAVGLVSQSAVEAEDATGVAHAGLAPARDAQDKLHSAGATGEFVSAATSD
jgi:hypothetical protein